MLKATVKSHGRQPRRKRFRARAPTRILLEAEADLRFGIETDLLPPSRTVVLSNVEAGGVSWEGLCVLLGILPPIEAFPIGPPREWRIFRDDRATSAPRGSSAAPWVGLMDDSPWALLPETDWPSRPCPNRCVQSGGTRLIHATMTTATPLFPGRAETFPGNLAAFARGGVGA